MYSMKPATSLKPRTLTESAPVARRLAPEGLQAQGLGGEGLKVQGLVRA